MLRPKRAVGCQLQHARGAPLDALNAESSRDEKLLNVPDVGRSCPLFGPIREAQHSAGSARLLSGGTEPGAQACDLWAIGGALRADEAIAHFGACGKAVAAVTGLMPDAAQDQRVDLALDQFVQSRWLQDTEPDRGMSGAKAVEPGAAKVEAGMTPTVTTAAPLGFSRAVASAMERKT